MQLQPAMGINRRSPPASHGRCLEMPALNRLFRLLAFVLLSVGALAAHAMDQTAYTPQTTTPERRAICDGMRRYVLEVENPTNLPQPILFKVDYLKVDGDYAGFEGYTLLQDGTPAAGVVLVDVVYTTFLHRGADNQWSVIADLTRTDVPDDAELRQIRKRFPKRIPTAVIPEFWRDKLR